MIWGLLLQRLWLVAAVADAPIAVRRTVVALIAVVATIKPLDLNSDLKV
jgi:hypothetical protein